jgi:signal transduction histidine kinase/CheY-like chemotaxis protein
MKPEAAEPTDQIASERYASSPIGASDTCIATEVRVPTRRRVSIRIQLASLVVACVLPVWIAAGFLVYYNYQSRRALTEQRMLETSRALTLVVDRELANMQANVNDLATSTPLVSGDLHAFYLRTQVVLKAQPGADIVLSDATGQELVNTFRPFGALLPKRGSLEGVRQVYATGRPVIANVYKGAATESLHVSVDVPVFRDGQVVYDLAVAVPLDRFAAVLSQQHLPPEWVGSIFDKNRTLVARTRLAREFVGRSIGPSLARQMNGTEGSAEVVNLEGIPMFDSYSRSATSGWTVVIGVPKAIMMAEIWRWLAWTIGCTALLSLTGIGLALLLAQRIAGSIQGLIAPALALGRGEPVATGQLDLAETNEVGESLLKASHLIQQRAAERERAQDVRREAEELKRFNAELELSEADARAWATELAAIMDAVPAVTFIAHDPECQRMTSNRAAYELLRMPPGTDASKSALHGAGSSNYRLLRNGRELSPDEMPVHWAAATGREIRDSEYTISFGDGSSRCILGNAVPLFNEAGRVRGAVGAFIDITERKREEDKNRALEQQLRQAQKMEAVGRLAGGIAHDFNNLLMVIQSYTEMLQDSLPAHNPLRKNTREIMKAAERAAALTGQMLAFSRKQIVAPVVLDLNAVIDETAKMLTRLIGEDIEFRVDSADSLWAIEADPDQIAQVLMNLCVNSRDALPQGGTLTIATGNVAVGEDRVAGHPCVSPGDYVSLSVTDTGTGISEQVQERIFEPFFTTKEVGKGTGLGLAMVYGMVEQSGGYVWVDSKLGMGTCFTIYLPRAKAPIAPEISAKAEARPRGAGILLIVEDEEALREAMCDYLRSLGYTVFAASSGQEALALASQQGHIDLLITDVVMPKMSGRELSQMLGSLRRDLKTIHMSGYTDDAVLRHGIQELGATFLQKPFSLGTLARKVHDTLGLPKPAR